MASIWDDPEMKVNDDFVKFEAVGDTITGDIIHVKAHRFDDNSVAPQILLNTVGGQLGGVTVEPGVEKTVTAGQVRLKAELATQRPEAGDRITITLTQEEKRSGGKTLKHFDVGVRHNVPPAQPAVQPAAATPQAAPAPATAPGVDPQALAAAMSALTPEQRKALGLA